jgi:DNA end-binding protein Ku
MTDTVPTGSGDESAERFARYLARLSADFSGVSSGRLSRRSGIFVCHKHIEVRVIHARSLPRAMTTLARTALNPRPVASMPPRSIANATISFGLVSVPVSLYSSAESKTSVSFNMLHKKCGGRLKQQYICPKDNNEVVGRDETVKGYEFAKDQYVVFSAEEIKAVEEKATNMIDVIEFIPLAQVQREYLEKVYYLAPDKGGDRAYRLLCEALMATGRAALGQYAARGKQNLILIRPVNGILAMECLHYADEVRSTNEVPVPEGEVKPAELALAKQLIEAASNDAFEPSKYRDTVRDRVMETIQRKVDGQDITTDVAADGGSKVLDLMEALKASLAGVQKGEDAKVKVS